MKIKPWMFAVYPCVFFALWLSFAYTGMELDPREWDGAMRFIHVLMASVLSFGIIGINAQ